MVNLRKTTLQKRKEVNVVQNTKLQLKEFQTACANGQLAVAQKLYKWNPNLNISAKNNYAFRYACANGHLVIIQQLYKWKPDLNISADNNFAFRMACTYGHLAVAQQLREWKPNLDISADYEGAFRGACAFGYLAVAQQLREWNPTLNISACNEAAFRMACYYGHLDVAQQLCKWKPDLNISALNEEAFCWACRNDQLFVAEWFHSLHPEKYQLQIKDGKIIHYLVVTPLPMIGTISMPSTDIQECPICYDAQCNVITSCGHQFCQSCIEHFENKFKCSYCRTLNITFQQIIPYS